MDARSGKGVINDDRAQIAGIRKKKAYWGYASGDTQFTWLWKHTAPPKVVEL